MRGDTVVPLNLQTVRVRTRWFDYDRGHLRYSYARLQVTALQHVPGEIDTVVSGNTIDGVAGYSAAASGVRYVDLRDFLTKWGATPLGAL